MDTAARAGARRRKRAWSRTACAVLTAALVASPAVAQEDGQGQRKIVSVTSTGDVETSTKHLPGRLQFGGGVGVSNADYFRGRFDGVPDGTDELQVAPELRITGDLSPGGGPSTSLTLGTSNSLWTSEVLPESSDFGPWYESNNYLGLATDLGNGFVAGLTYTIYTSPNGVFPTAHEVAVAGSYARPIAGLPLSPQIKVAVPVDDGEGAFTQLDLKAFSTDLAVFGSTVTFSIPVTLGIGWDDYYGGGTDTTGYLSAGADLEVPLTNASDSGAWTLKLGFDAIGRAEDLADADPAVAGNDRVVYMGTVALNFTY